MRCWLLLAVLGVWLSGCAAGVGTLVSREPPARGWDESEFTVRPAVEHAYAVEPDVRLRQTVIGEPVPYRIRARDTLLDVARHSGLGINELRDAFPDLDPWIPPAGVTIELPTWWVLPESRLEGVILNIPEMRLYYFPKGDGRGVITYPVGLGRDDWRTPTGRFRIGEKTENPTWVIPASIRKERLREKGRTETQILGGDPENPLGRYRMRLANTLYAIHGTNAPWGVGEQVSHGCIRLYPEDIEVLFPEVPVGTPVAIVYQPVKVGARDGEVYVEVHRSIYRERFDYLGIARSLLSRKGWLRLVDPKALERAVEEKRGVPVPVSRPLAASTVASERSGSFRRAGW